MLSCTISARSIYVRLTPEDVASKTQWEAGEAIQLSIGSITNPLSFGLTDSFRVYVATNLVSDYYVNQLEAGLSIANNEAGAMRDVRVLPETNQLGVTTNYAVYFTIAQELPAGGYVDITFPRASFSNLDAVTCSAITGAAVTTCRVPTETIVDPATGVVRDTSNVIRVERAAAATTPPNTEIGLLLRGIQNPASSVPAEVVRSEFSIQTKSQDGYPIDASSDLYFAIGCISPCETCEAEQSKCLTCLSQADGTPLNFFAAESTCLPECPVGYRQNAANVCEACDIPCGACSTALDFCDSCDAQYGSPYADPATGFCHAECPAGTYKNAATRRCEPCVNGCLTCLSPDECLSCNPGAFFLDGQCLAECPATAIKFDSATRQECELCLEPCYTCEGTTDTCLTCITGFYFHENACVSECPTNYEVND